MGLEDKTLVELRSIAQGYGVRDLFRLRKNELIQRIELAQRPDKPEAATVVIPQPDYDRRLATKPPALSSGEDTVDGILERHKAAGLHVRYDEERWYMSFQGRTDEGSLRMPLRTVLRCAERLMGMR